MDGLKTGNEALKQANAMFTIEEIEQIMDDTAEAVDKQREISDLIGGQPTGEDEDDALRELEELERMEAERLAEGEQKEEEDVQLPDVPTDELPGESSQITIA